MAGRLSGTPEGRGGVTMSRKDDRPSDELIAFAEAELVNPDYVHNDLPSDLFAATAADIAQATAAVVHSPHGGVGGPSKVTSTIHGAGRTLHLISYGTTGRSTSWVRGLLVLILTVAVTLLVVDVLVPEAPGWVTTVGFALFLGGIGAVAIKARQPLLGLVLLTLGLPLVVWSLTPDPAAEGAAQWLGPVITVAGVVVVMAIIGHVSEPDGHEAARAPARGPARTDPGHTKQDPTSGRGLRTAVVAAIVLLAFSGALYWVLCDLLLGDMNPFVYVILGAVGLAAALIGGGSLRVLSKENRDPEATVGSWTYGLGLLYLVLGAGLLVFLAVHTNSTTPESDAAAAASPTCSELTTTGAQGSVLTLISCPPPDGGGQAAQAESTSIETTDEPEATVRRYLPLTVSLILLGLAGTTLPAFWSSGRLLPRAWKRKP